jgi:hypothetical protein
MSYPNCNRLDDAQLAFQHHQSRQINELNANVRQLMVLVQARAEMSPVPGQCYEYGACASFIPEFGVASGRDFIFRPRCFDELPPQHCVPWSAKENGACNGTTTGGLFNANGGRCKPPCTNTLVTAASAADYPMDGDKKLVSPAAEVAPDTDTAPGPGVAPSGKENVATPHAAGVAPGTDTAPGPGVAPSGKECVATPHAAKIIVPVVHNNNRKGNSGGFNGLVGDKKLVGAAAGDAPDTVTARGPGVAPSGKEKVATPRAVKIIVPDVHNDNRKGNSGGLNGFSLFKGHKKLCWINKVDMSLDEYVMYMITPEGITSHKNKSVTKVGQLAQWLKHKGQKGANAYFANQWKDLPTGEKAKYKHYALCIKLVLYKAKSFQQASLKSSSAGTDAPTGERNLVGV